jgi:hypothetical protein
VIEVRRFATAGVRDRGFTPVYRWYRDCGSARSMSEENTSVAPVTGPATALNADRPIEVVGTTVRIHDLCIERPGIVAYLGRIAPDKQEIALVHALDVGITELIARRERFQR